MQEYPDNVLKEQLTLWPATRETNSPSQEDESSANSPEIIPVSFRDLVPEIKDTGYLTHSIYYYPAKFIPHVIRYCVQSFTKENDWLVDPFAGSGSVGLEAYLYKRNSFLLDLNPLLNHIIPVKIYRGKTPLSEGSLFKLLNGLSQSTIYFYPQWANLKYWYPGEILEVLSRYWGWQKSLGCDIYSAIIESALLKVSKHFSYAEHKVPKLFKSKRKIQYIEGLRQTGWRDKLDEMVFTLSLEALKAINQLIFMTAGHDNEVLYKGGVDSSDYQFDAGMEFDILITSPPYLQAQEYIRTAKMDLYWLGYNDQEIKRLSQLEIPYRKPNRMIHTKTLEEIKSQLRRDDLIKVLDSYFCHTINALESAMSRLKKGAKACIFIGSPKCDEVEVESWKIVMEYFADKGYSLEGVYEDKIKSRQLFGSRKNKNPEGMKAEYLLILNKA